MRAVQRTAAALAGAYVVALAAGALCACRRDPQPSRPEPPPPPAPGSASRTPEAIDAGTSGQAEPDSAADAAAMLPPLAEAEALVDLPVPGFGNAQVAVPQGARSRRPLVIVLHGIWDPPDVFCPLWRTIVGQGVFILCPRGVRNPNDGPNGQAMFMYANNDLLRREIDAAIAALRARFPQHVDPERPVYSGFSQSSTMGASIVRQAPKRFPRVIFIEGASRWTREQAVAFRKGGGVRVLHACGQGGCLAPSRAATEELTRAGVEARTVYGAGMGHATHGKVADAIRESFYTWLVADDPRFVEAAPAP